MATAGIGYSRNELSNSIMGMIGQQSAKLQDYIYRNITAWQYQFYDLHDWSFAHNNSRATLVPTLTTVIGQRTYRVDTMGSPIVLTSNIEFITCITPGFGRPLEDGTLRNFRMSDPEGRSRGRPTIWLPININTIELYPIPNVVESFIIEGKAEPNFISGIGAGLPADYALDVPYKYQDLFLQFCFIKALRFERDPRRKEELLIFKDELRSAIAEDMRHLESNARMMTANEYHGSGAPYDLNSRLWYTGGDF